jgi:hypothetical protein
MQKLLNHWLAGQDMAESSQKFIRRNKPPRVQIEYDVEGEAIDKETLKHIADLQFKYSVVGLVLGMASIILGCILLYVGITGESSFAANAVGMKTELNDAAPGTVLLIIGLLIIYVTRFKFTVKKRK